MQISEIILYSHEGQRRTLSLEINSVNIISGSSNTGKSALIDIVDYCLGSSVCHIAAGPIRDSVDWFALKLQFPSNQVFVARKNPPP